MIKSLRKVLLVGALSVAYAACATSSPTSDLPRCLFVSSYHKGYAWSDGVERGLRQSLAGACELRQFDMDSKRRKTTAEITAAAEQALRLVKEWQPDVLITADDHAAKYLVHQYLNNTDLPIVFCGVNWSADEYGFPSANVTGMIEVAPIKPMLKWGDSLVGGAKRVFYLGAATLTEEKNAARIAAAADAIGLQLDARLATTTEEWLQAYEDAQGSDFVILGSNAGIDNWHDQRVRDAIAPLTRKLSLTSHGWMMPYAQFGMTKVPEEHGDWSGQAALSIINHNVSPSEIPVVVNRQWNYWVNNGLLALTGVELPQSLRNKARRVN